MSDLKNLQDRVDGNAASPTGMKVWATAMVKVTVGELKSAIANHPSCPQATAFTNAIKKLGDKTPDDYIITVCKADLECLLKKCGIKDVQSIDAKTGATVITRELDSAPKPAASPKT